VTTEIHTFLADHRGELVRELAGWLRLRSVGGIPELVPELNLSAHWLAATLREIGRQGPGHRPPVGIRAHLAGTGRDAPAVNLKVLVEGEEETGFRAPGRPARRAPPRGRPHRLLRPTLARRSR
jgi:hypothetical protein